MNEKNSVSDYYDRFSRKLLFDFIIGNKRAEKAIFFACQHLAQNNRKRVLDLGFGLGWSSYEFSRALPEASVLGLDLSPRLTELASTIFVSPRMQRLNHLRYVCQDLTDKEWNMENRESYDACVMLDVYEHIPREARAEFHHALSSLLSPDALVIFSCPTSLHQDFLRRENPEGLQPIDEDVTLKEIGQFAEDIQGTVTHFEYRSIWRSNDYLYCVVSRAPILGPIQTMCRHALLGKSCRMSLLERASKTIGRDLVQEIRKSRPSLLCRCVLRAKRMISQRG